MAKKVVENILLDRSETKHRSTQINAEVNNIGAITHLSGISQGSTETTRVGDKITPVSLTWKFCLENINVGSQLPSCVRLMIVRSRIPDRFLVVADLPTLLGKSDYNNIFVLYDKYLTVSGNAGAGPQSITRKVFIKKKRFLRLTYKATTLIDLNGIYFFAVGDTAPANANSPDIKGNFELSFKDI